jgi:hypothetical protein
MSETMITVEIELHPETDLSSAESIIERSCMLEGLRMTVKRPLTKHSGKIHWHFRKGTESGTLEITLVPEERRIWFSVHSNRKGPWIQASIDNLKPTIEHGLKS